MKTIPPITRKPFPLGQTVVTPTVLAQIHAEDISAALSRHGQCDWGDCCPRDWRENDKAVDKSLRLFSVYHDRNSVEFWVITEADWSATTILLPEDY